MSRVAAIKRAEKFAPYTMSILSKELGDREITWNPEDGGSVAVAEREFDNALGNGMFGMSVGAEGVGSEVITKFEPTAEAIVVAPQIQGG